VYATNQEGIYIVLPVHRTTQTLRPDSVTAIVTQVKNAEDYEATLDASLFNAMDSVVKSAIFSTLSVDSVPDSDLQDPRAQEKETEGYPGGDSGKGRVRSWLSNYCSIPLGFSRACHNLQDISRPQGLMPRRKSDAGL